MKIDIALLRASQRSWWDSSGPRVGPWWLQWVWTILFCAVLAVGFTILGFMLYANDSEGAWRNWAGWALWYGKNFVVCLVIGSMIHIAFDTLGWLMGGLHKVHTWKSWQRTLFFSGVPVLCSVVGWPLGVSLIGTKTWSLSAMSGNAIAVSVLLSLMLTFIFHQFFAIKSRQVLAEKRAAEAQLRLLQGQIEPHFLFNTLAGVLSLIDHEPAKAKQMLHDFTEYLRTSLGQLRNENGPLAQELDLAEHYLRLLGARMEERLSWSIDADEAARHVSLPPLLLQPLVENAIHHGLEPQLEGGHVKVSARVQGQQLVLEVHDNGRAPAAAARPGARKGNGVALKNIRERLLSHYGHAASLELHDAHPGTRAVLRLPVKVANPMTALPGAH